MTLQHIKPTREHVRHGIKVGLACVLALIVSGSIGVPYAYWAVITTVIVMQMHVADSIRMSFYRFSGTAIGAFIGIVAILIFRHSALHGTCRFPDHGTVRLSDQI